MVKVVGAVVALHVLNLRQGQWAFAFLTALLLLGQLHGSFLVGGGGELAAGAGAFRPKGLGSGHAWYVYGTQPSEMPRGRTAIAVGAVGLHRASSKLRR